MQQEGSEAEIWLRMRVSHRMEAVYAEEGTKSFWQECQWKY